VDKRLPLLFESERLRLNGRHHIDRKDPTCQRVRSATRRRPQVPSSRNPAR